MIYLSDVGKVFKPYSDYEVFFGGLPVLVYFVQSLCLGTAVSLYFLHYGTFVFLEIPLAVELKLVDFFPQPFCRVCTVQGYN